MALIGCQTEKTEPSVDFKTIVFNLDSPKDSIGFWDWQKSYLLNQDQLEIDTLFSLDTIPVGELYYSDEQFLVYGFCMGEFGGALMFQDKKLKDSIYYLECACPVMIDKREDGYYITQSLAHLDGFGKVKYFKSPKSLVNVHLDSLRTDWKARKYPSLNEYEIWEELENQGEVLIDTIGLTFNIFFLFKGLDYLIFSDYNQTLLALFTSDSLQVIDTLINRPSWRYNNIPNEITNGFYHYNFGKNDGSPVQVSLNKKSFRGDIFVRNDTIVIAYRK